MTDQEIKATLRKAVSTGVIVGWQLLANGEWTINPSIGPCHNKDWLDVRAYCQALKRSGVRP